MEASFTGPLPPPGLLRSYEDACPGAAQRLIAMAEEQGTHRRRLEEKMANAGEAAMKLQFTENKRGQISAVAVAFAFLIAGVWVVVSGHAWPGAVLGLGGGGVGLAPIINAFLRRRGESGPVPEKPAPEQPQKSVTRKRKR